MLHSWNVLVTARHKMKKNRKRHEEWLGEFYKPHIISLVGLSLKIEMFSDNGWFILFSDYFWIVEFWIDFKRIWLRFDRVNDELCLSHSFHSYLHVWYNWQDMKMLINKSTNERRHCSGFEIWGTRMLNIC